nr:hypothetical protein [Candidatus Sigynarchaeum springense]MDO8118308.1 hypothetical protein [Candidatus Sigynarchaeota archaeon]
MYDWNYTLEASSSFETPIGLSQYLLLPRFQVGLDESWYFATITGKGQVGLWVQPSLLVDVNISADVWIDGAVRNKGMIGRYTWTGDGQGKIVYALAKDDLREGDIAYFSLKNITYSFKIKEFSLAVGFYWNLLLGLWVLDHYEYDVVTHGSGWFTNTLGLFGITLNSTDPGNPAVNCYWTILTGLEQLGVYTAFSLLTEQNISFLTIATRPYLRFEFTATLESIIGIRKIRITANSLAEISKYIIIIDGVEILTGSDLSTDIALPFNMSIGNHTVGVMVFDALGNSQYKEQSMSYTPAPIVILEIAVLAIGLVAMLSIARRIDKNSRVKANKNCDFMK